MKKLSSLPLIIISTAGLALAQAPLDVLKSEIVKTGGLAVSAESLNGLETLQLPVPAASKSPSKIQNAAMTYFPIDRRIEYVYEYKSTDFLGPKKLIVTIDNYSEKDASASVHVTIIKGDKVSKFYHRLYMKDDGIYSTNNFIAGPRMEIPNSIYRGKEWIEHGNRNWITTIDTTVNTAAGSFKHCVKIKTAINNGDAGRAERYYARGVGLVYEKWEAEDRNDELKLLSFSIR